MDATNHRGITKFVLQGTFGVRALKIIKDGNVDSDKPGAGGECAEQHFHFHGSHVTDPSLVIERSTAFWQSSMSCAALLARSENDDHRELALYFIGRALHCAQDFFAHSNFVALMKSTQWNGAMVTNLNFCLPTPGNTAQKLKANRSGYWPELRGSGNKPKKLSGGDLKRASVKRMRDGENPIPHPELQLDFPGSWADRALTEVTGQRAWDRAFYGACKGTENAYLYFENEMKRNQGEDLFRRMKHIVLSEGYAVLGKEAMDHKNGQAALTKFKSFTPWGRGYSSISSRSASAFKKAQRRYMDLQFSRFGGAMWNTLQAVTNM